MRNWMTVSVVLGAMVLMVSYRAFSEPATMPSSASGRFTTSAGQETVMVDTATGDTWVLERHPATAEATWLPVRRLRDDKDASRWYQEKRDTVDELKLKAELKNREQAAGRK